MDSRKALHFVEQHGIVLEAANGPVPTLSYEIVGERIRGSWWGHPDSHHIYAVLSSVRDSADVLVFRLINDKITYAHRRVWPALVCLADEIGPDRLTAVEEIHTPSGRHETVNTPFPDWVESATSREATVMQESAARALLPRAVFESYGLRSVD